MQCRVTIAANCTALYIVRYVPGHERAVFIYSNNEWRSLESVHNEYDINTSGLQLISRSRSIVTELLLPWQVPLDTLCSSDYITSNGRITVGHEFEFIWKEITTLEFACDDWGKPQKHSTRRASVPAEFPSGHLWITSLERYRFANLLGDTIHMTWLWLSFRSFTLFLHFKIQYQEQQSFSE